MTPLNSHSPILKPLYIILRVHRKNYRLVTGMIVYMHVGHDVYKIFTHDFFCYNSKTFLLYISSLIKYLE